MDQCTINLSRERTVLLENRRACFTGVLVFNYRGVIIVRDPLEHGGRYFLESDTACLGDKPALTFSTLELACDLADYRLAMTAVETSIFNNRVSQ